MKWVVFSFASLVFACSSTKDPGTDPKDTGAPEVCVPFDAGPRGEAAVPQDTMAGDDAAIDGAPAKAPDAGPVVTKAEIDDIFKTSCSFNTCHGAKPGKGNLYIPGPPANWYTSVVDVPSSTNKKMKRVVPYDPQASFLVHKLTDGLCALSADCVDKNCGDRMPQANDPLDPSDLHKIIEWIRQGAKE